jgi:hypothetical protein
VPHVDFIARKSSAEIGGIAAGMISPALKRLVEVNIDHDATEIEQKRIRGAGGEAG